MPGRYPEELTLVDESMAPLLSQLWEQGIRTFASCQELETGEAYIAFTTTDDAQRFLQLLVPNARYTDHFSQRAMNCELEVIREGEWVKLSGAWTHSTDIQHLDPDGCRHLGAPFEVSPYPPEERKPFFTTALYFPATDLPLILARLQKETDATEDEEACAGGVSGRS